MTEDPIERVELSSINRRVEGIEDRVESLQVQLGGNSAAIINGQASLRREVRDGFARMDTFILEQREFNKGQQAASAQIIELLSNLVGRDAGK